MVHTISQSLVSFDWLDAKLRHRAKSGVPLIRTEMDEGRAPRPQVPLDSSLHGVFAPPPHLLSDATLLQMRAHQQQYQQHAAFKLGDDLEQQQHSEDQNPNEDATSSPTGSSGSSKEKWSKRHMCSLPECGKSFDSKWALIRYAALPAVL